MENEHPRLILDEQLFLLALRGLADLEDEGEKFSLLNAVKPFTNESYLGSRFSLAVGREIESDDKRVIDYYIGAIYLVYHHRASIEGLDEVFDELTPAVEEFIRMAAWSFLSAWNFRYGGVYASRVVGHTLVDPTEPS